MFITFEGGEGAGKSTQIALLANLLTDSFGTKVVVTREPGGTELGETIRKLILAERPAVPETEFLLFAAARAEHIATTIGPALDNGSWVLCDRFIDSTRVYQGRLGGVSSTLIEAIEAETLKNRVPDLTIILDIPAQLSIDRARSRGALSRYDCADIDQHALLREGFLDIAKAEPGRCIVVDGSRSADDVANDVFCRVTKRFAKELG